MSHDVIIATARSQIAAHKSVGENWNTYFKTQQEAAESWLNYQARHPRATLEEWLAECTPIQVLRDDPNWVI